MCLICAPSADKVLARRNHVLQLLALVERPGTLPADAALRLAQEILALARADGAALRCESVSPPRAAAADTGDGGIP